MEIYSKEAVETAIKLTAMGVGGFLEKEYAKKQLEKLPESLKEMVILSTVVASPNSKYL